MMYANGPLTPSRTAAPDTQWALQLIVPASEWSVRYSLHSIKTGISHLGFTCDDIITIELVTAEVLNNIIEHAYNGTEQGMISVELNCHNQELSCTITDNGRPMPNGVLPEGLHADTTRAIQDLPEGGFGWPLIRRLTRKLHYTRQDSKNILTYHIRTNCIA